MMLSCMRRDRDPHVDGGQIGEGREAPWGCVTAPPYWGTASPPPPWYRWMRRSVGFVCTDCFLFPFVTLLNHVCACMVPVRMSWCVCAYKCACACIRLCMCLSTSLPPWPSSAIDHAVVWGRNQVQSWANTQIVLRLGREVARLTPNGVPSSTRNGL